MELSEKDKIRIAVKKQALDSVIGYYGAFGWELTAQSEDERYEDVAHLSFERPHYIENKDDLHLLQAKLEIAINNTGKYASRKKSRATAFGRTTGLIAICAIAAGVCLIVLLGTAIGAVFGGIACAAGAVLCTISAIFSYRIFKKDTKKYNELMRLEVEKIDGYCERAKAIRGVL